MNRLSCVVLLVAIATTAAVVSATDPNPDPTIIQTRSGPVQGVAGAKAFAWRGIPYGASTAGARRWTSPIPPAPWAPSVRPATVDGPGCPQFCFGPTWMCPPVTSEDCLTLNVFTPRNPSTADGPLAVLVWLPGGNFFQGYGGGMLYDGSNFVNRSNTIVVAVTYRLGAAGFLYSPKNGINGMHGIEDQRLAMQWVRDNIANFGGDPNKVTLFGQSAGAGSVGIHLQSAESSPLFARAIMQSNMLTIPLREPDEALPLAAAFAKLLNCTADDLVCLRSKSEADMVEAEEKTRSMIELDLKRPLQAFMPWTPVVGAGQPVPSQPMIYLTKPNFNKPLIIGTVSQETTIFIYEAFGKPMTKFQYDLAIALICKLENLGKIEKFYPPPAGDLRDATSILGNHYIFNCPNRNITRALSNKMPVWFYYFDHLMSFGKDGWGPKFPFCVDKVCHGSELPFVFYSYPLAGFTGTTDEMNLSYSFIDYWSNFAKTGDPNRASLASNTSSPSLVNWPAYSTGNDLSMRVVTPAFRTETGLLKDRCDFWDSIGYDLP